MFLKTTAPPAVEEQGAMELTLGAFLKEARLSQGLDLEAIAHETKINYKNLAALEDDNRSQLPADVFSRGFVRLYAAHLKLDPQQAIRLYEKQWGVDGSSVGRPLIAKKIPSIPARPGIFLSLLVVAIFFWVRFEYPELPGPTGVEKDATDSQGTGKISSAGKGGSEAVLSSSQPAADPKGAGTAISPGMPSGLMTAAEKIMEVMGQAEKASERTESGQSVPVAPTPAYAITLHAANPITIKLKIDGQEAVVKALLPGDSQTWQAAKGFALTLDRTDGVELTVNGALVPIKTEAGQTVTIERP